LRHEAIDRVGLPQVEVFARRKYDVAILALEPPQQRRADHAGKSGDENPPASEIENDRRTAHALSSP
jgi:hypothetical protein